MSAPDPPPPIQTEIHKGIFSASHQLRMPVTTEERIQSQQRFPAVCCDAILMFAIPHRVPVAEGYYKGTSLEVAGEAAGEAAEKFGPLKVALNSIPPLYANHQVRQQSPWYSPLTNSFQESAAIANKIEILLSDVVDLEKCFDSRPGDVAELGRRYVLIR